MLENVTVCVVLGEAALLDAVGVVAQRGDLEPAPEVLKQEKGIDIDTRIRNKNADGKETCSMSKSGFAAAACGHSVWSVLTRRKERTAAEASAAAAAARQRKETRRRDMIS